MFDASARGKCHTSVEKLFDAILNVSGSVFYYPKCGGLRCLHRCATAGWLETLPALGEAVLRRGAKLPAGDFVVGSVADGAWTAVRHGRLPADSGESSEVPRDRFGSSLPLFQERHSVEI